MCDDCKKRRYRTEKAKRARTGSWHRIRTQVKERDGYRCRACGRSQVVDGVRLEVHHIDGDPTNHALDNLVTLCHDCHVARTREERGRAKGSPRAHDTNTQDRGWSVA